jgi:hypothetical protein
MTHQATYRRRCVPSRSVVYHNYHPGKWWSGGFNIEYRAKGGTFQPAAALTCSSLL